MAEKKELTVEAKELAKDPAVNVVEVKEVVVEKDETLVDKYKDSVTQAAKDAGIAVGFVAGSVDGASSGIQGEDDHRADTAQTKSLGK